MPMRYSRIKTSDVTNFPLSEDQKKILQERVMIKVKLNKGHGASNVQKDDIFTNYLYGEVREPITLRVINVKQIGGRTVVTLKRERDE